MNSNKILNSLDVFYQNMVEGCKFNSYELKNYLEPVFESTGYRDKNSNNILIVHDAGVGDLINLSPAIRAIRDNYPTHRITLICSSHAYFSVRACPYVDSIFYNDKVNESSDFVGMFEWQMDFVKNLLPVKFDIAFCFCHRIGSILLAYLSGAKKLVHYNSTVICSPNNFGLQSVIPLINMYIRANFSKSHMVDRYLGILDGYFQKPVTDRSLESWHEPRALDKVKEILNSVNFLGKTVVAMSFGGSSLDKHYPPEKYAQLMNLVAEKIPSANFIHLGGHGDFSSGETFLNEFNYPDKFLNLAGKINFAETSAILSLADLFIGNDTSTTHIAAANKIPCLQPNCFPMDHQINLDSSPMIYYPYGVPTVLVMPIKSLPECVESNFFRGCNSNVPHCITQINIDTLFEGFKLLIKKIHNNDCTPTFIY